MTPTWPIVWNKLESKLKKKTNSIEDDCHDHTTCNCGPFVKRIPRPNEMREWYHYWTRKGSKAHRLCSVDAYCGKLQTQSYYQDDLARMVVENASVPLEKKLSIDEMLVLQAPPPEYVPRGKCKEYLKSYFEIFDKAFFFGAVGKKLRRLKTKPRKACDDNHAFSELAHYAGWSRKIVMRLETELSGEPRTVGELVETLLHEMVHAFLSLYTCRCTMCQQSEKWLPCCETSGHRAAFVNCLRSIEQAMELNLDWAVNGGVSISVNLEIWETLWRPTREALQSWGVRLIPGTYAIYEMEESLLVKKKHEDKEREDANDCYGTETVKEIAEALFMNGPGRAPVFWLRGLHGLRPHWNELGKWGKCLIYRHD